MTKNYMAHCLIIITGLLAVCGGSESEYDSWSASESAFRTFVLMQAGGGDSLRYGKVLVDRDFGFVIREANVSGNIIAIRMDSGHATRVRIRQPEWATNGKAPGSDISIESVKKCIKEWDFVKALGYPNYIKFDEPADDKALRKTGLAVLNRTSKYGIIDGERMIVSLYYDKSGKRISPGMVTTYVSLFDADMVEYVAPERDTRQDEVIAVFKASTPGKKILDQFEMANTAYECIVDQRPILIHPDLFFQDGKNVLTTNLVNPFVFGRSFTLTVRVGATKRVFKGAYDYHGGKLAMGCEVPAD